MLAVELLKQSQGQARAASTFNRSEVIQNLSSLVAALKWAVFKYDGNFEICNQARQVLQQILERVLDGDNGSTAEGVESVESVRFDSSWLDQVSSEPAFWSSLPQHPLLAEL